MENKMFCYQCQETAGCTGCTSFGMCGKTPNLSNIGGITNVEDDIRLFMA